MILYLGTKTTKPGEPKVLELGSKIWFSRPIFWQCVKWYNMWVASFEYLLLLLQSEWGTKRLVNPMTVTLSLTFLFFYYFGHKIKFLGQNKNIVCDTKTVNNTFNMSTDGGAGSNGQQTSIHIMHLFQGGKKLLPPQWWKESNVINSSPGGWLVFLENVAMLGTQLCSLPLTCWYVGHSAVAARSALVRKNQCCWVNK